MAGAGQRVGRIQRVSMWAAAGVLVVSTVGLGQDGTGGSDVEVATSLPMGRLLWTSDRARDGGLSVWMLESGAIEPRRLTTGRMNDFSPELSPDGTMIAFASDRGNPDALTARGSYLRAYDLYLAGVDGDEPVQLHGERTFKMRPSWSPDGSRVAYDGEDPDGEPVAETGGLTPQIWVIPSDGSGPPEMITDAPDGALEPAWSPDGSRIAYRTLADGRIISMATDGSDVTRLTDSPDFDGQPTWSPDGTMIAFASDRGASRDIYLMNADGSDQVDLSGNGPGDDGEHRGSDFSPSWSE